MADELKSFFLPELNQWVKYNPSKYSEDMLRDRILQTHQQGGSVADLPNTIEMELAADTQISEVTPEMQQQKTDAINAEKFFGDQAKGPISGPVQGLKTNLIDGLMLGQRPRVQGAVDAVFPPSSALAPGEKAYGEHLGKLNSLLERYDEAKKMRTAQGDMETKENPLSSLAGMLVSSLEGSPQGLLRNATYGKIFGKAPVAAATRTGRTFQAMKEGAKMGVAEAPNLNLMLPDDTSLGDRASLSATTPAIGAMLTPLIQGAMETGRAAKGGLQEGLNEREWPERLYANSAGIPTAEIKSKPGQIKNPVTRLVEDGPVGGVLSLSKQAKKMRTETGEKIGKTLENTTVGLEDLVTPSIGTKASQDNKAERLVQKEMDSIKNKFFKPESTQGVMKAPSRDEFKNTLFKDYFSSAKYENSLLDDEEKLMTQKLMDSMPPDEYFRHLYGQAFPKGSRKATKLAEGDVITQGLNAKQTKGPGLGKMVDSAFDNHQRMVKAMELQGVKIRPEYKNMTRDDFANGVASTLSEPRTTKGPTGVMKNPTPGKWIKGEKEKYIAENMPNLERNQPVELTDDVVDMWYAKKYPDGQVKTAETSKTGRANAAKLNQEKVALSQKYDRTSPASALQQKVDKSVSDSVRSGIEKNNPAVRDLNEQYHASRLLDEATDSELYSDAPGKGVSSKWEAIRNLGNMLLTAPGTTAAKGMAKGRTMLGVTPPKTTRIDASRFTIPSSKLIQMVEMAKKEKERKRALEE